MRRERCPGRLINPIRPLGLWQHVPTVCLLAGHQDMLACGGDGGKHEIGIALPLAMLLTEAFQNGRTGGVEDDHVELGEQLLCLQ